MQKIESNQSDSNVNTTEKESKHTLESSVAMQSEFTEKDLKYHWGGIKIQYEEAYIDTQFAEKFYTDQKGAIQLLTGLLIAIQLMAEIEMALILYGLTNAIDDTEYQLGFTISIIIGMVIFLIGGLISTGLLVGTKYSYNNLSDDQDMGIDLMVQDYMKKEKLKQQQSQKANLLKLTAYFQQVNILMTAAAFLLISIFRKLYIAQLPARESSSITDDWCYQTTLGFIVPVLGMFITSSQINFRWIVNAIVFCGLSLILIGMIYNEISLFIEIPVRFWVFSIVYFVLLNLFAASTMKRSEIRNRINYVIIMDITDQTHQLKVLEELPDGIIIADRINIRYLNAEAWKILNCRSVDKGKPIEEVMCVERKLCSIMTPIQQLINYLRNVDKKLGTIDQDVFLQQMIEMASQETVLLHMHQALSSPCDENDSDDLDNSQEDLLLDQDVEKVKKTPWDELYYDVKIKSLFAPGGRDQQIIFIFTDVSAEKELQRELVMKQYSQVMFASVSHELRTPINAIQNSLKCWKPHVEQQTSKFYEICISSSSFLLSLVNDTLDFAQMKAGKFRLMIEQVKIRDLIYEVVQLLNVQLAFKKQQVFLIDIVDEDVPIYIETDMQRLKQVLINLLRNSTKFTFKGFIQLTISTSALANQKKDGEINQLSIKPAIQFEVYDTGIGISEDNQKALFSLFGKVSQKNKAINKEGIGLGLYITKNLVQELGGVITLDSQEGEYSKFVVTIPQGSTDEPFSEANIDQSVATFKSRQINNSSKPNLDSKQEIQKIESLIVLNESQISKLNLKPKAAFEIEHIDSDEEEPALSEINFRGSEISERLDEQLNRQDFDTQSIQMGSSGESKHFAGMHKSKLPNNTRTSSNSSQTTTRAGFHQQHLQIMGMDVASNESSVVGQERSRSQVTKKIIQKMNKFEQESMKMIQTKKQTQKKARISVPTPEGRHAASNYKNVQHQKDKFSNKSQEYKVHESVTKQRRQTSEEAVKHNNKLILNAEKPQPKNQQSQSPAGRKKKALVKSTFSKLKSVEMTEEEESVRLNITDHKNQFDKYVNKGPQEEQKVDNNGNVFYPCSFSQEKKDWQTIMSSKSASVNKTQCVCKPVLICEDNSFNYETFACILRQLNFDSDWAENGQQGVEMFIKSFNCCPYKIVFMDCDMPIMNGYKASAEIIKFQKAYTGTNKPLTDAHIIALTADVTQREKEKCKQAGMGFLPKPPPTEALKRELKKIS